jgi:16S rRNA (cytosine967-C5)-methyltransferase
VAALLESRELALSLLQRIEREQSYANLVLPKALAQSGLSQADRAFTQELLYGAIRWQLSYNAIAAHLSKTIDPGVAQILTLGLHQLFRMRVPEHAAIHTTVELAKRHAPRAANFVNALLRKAQRSGLDSLIDEITADLPRHEALAIRFSHPAWVVSQYLSALASRGMESELEAMLAAHNEPPAVNLVALDEAAMAELDAADFARGNASPIGFLADSRLALALETPGVRVQDQGSQLVTLALLAAAPEAKRLADVCAGPGGKAALLAAKMPPDANLDCLEISESRAQLVREAVANYPAVVVTAADARDLPSAQYDAILLDAPCSSLGSVRRKPETRWRKRSDELSGLNKLQSELLASAITALRPGGVVAYITCSPLLTETQAVVAQALERNSVELMNANRILNSITPSLELDESRNTAQLYTHRHETDSMFLALIRKVG